MKAGTSSFRDAAVAACTKGGQILVTRWALPREQEMVEDLTVDDNRRAGAHSVWNLTAWILDDQAASVGCEA